jgi:hypothetical protein
MGSSTQGFVATDKKDVFEIAQIIYDFLGTRYSNHDLKRLKKIASVRAEFEICVPHAKGFRVHFLDGDEKRMLYVWFDCDCDMKDIHDGQKIIFSLGCWGKSDEIIKGILARLKHLGKIYYVYNNCAEEEWQELV